MKTDAITKFELEAGLVAYDAKNLPDVKTVEEFKEYVNTPEHRYDFAPCNIDDRLKFLKDNNYEITRENITDPSLSTRQPE